MHRQASPLILSLILCSAVTLCVAAPRKAKHLGPRPAGNQVKGQGQIAGADGRFGTIYSLKDKFNFEILSAHYTVEPFAASSPLTAETDKKLVVLDIAIKNADPADNFFNPDQLFTLVDAQGQLYPSGALALTSRSSDSASMTLRPGQGLGQPALSDPLRYAVVVPAKARIVKIMINQGRLNSSEDVLRYYVAGATAAEAGKAGDPKNVIAPLPDAVRDPSDPSGAAALESGKGTAGVFLPSGGFALRLDGISYTSDPLVDGNAPDDGKQFAVATVTARSLIDKSQSMFDVTGGDNSLYAVTDSDGETDKSVAFLKAKANETADHDFKLGDEYTFRVVFSLAKGATAKTLVLGAGGSRTWTFDVPRSAGG